MAVLHRALITWFLALIFLILLVIRLDQKSNWNWFIVFIPMWIFDGTVLIYSIFFMINRCKSMRNSSRGGSNSLSMTSKQYCTLVIKRRLYYVAGILLKMTTQILLCLKLEIPSLNIPLYYVFMPLWVILLVGILRISHVLYILATSTSMKEIRSQLISRGVNSTSLGISGVAGAVGGSSNAGGGDGIRGTSAMLGLVSQTNQSLSCTHR